MISSDNKYKSSNTKFIKRFYFKDFKIVFCKTIKDKNYVTKKWDWQFTAYIRNNNWVDTEFIYFNSETFQDLKFRVRSFLKKPDLSDENKKKLKVESKFTDMFRTKKKKESEDFLRKKSKMTAEEYDREYEISEDNFDSFEDAQEIVWNELEEDWSNN